MRPRPAFRTARGSLALGGFALAALALAPAARAQAPADPGVPVPKFWTSADADTVRFVAMGDFGTGGGDQWLVGDAVRRVCAARGCRFVLGLGDLIYEGGVESPTDPQFDSKFETPYGSVPLPFYQAMGNHDNSGPHGDGADNAKGNHMVAYSYRPVGGDGGRATDKWRMPSRYFTFQHGGVAQFYALDSSPLQYADVRWQSAYPNYERDHAAWLARERAASTARWHVVFAHHPYRSNGNHGDAGHYNGVPGWAEPYEAFVEGAVCPNADLFLTGHDHMLQWLMSPGSCPNTAIVVAGAGAKTSPITAPNRNPAFFQIGSTRGFFWAELTRTTFRGVFYDDAGTALFERTVTKGALPVELLSFAATADGDRVRLRWATASETANAGFHVEHRPADEGTWRSAGFVAGAGTTAERRTYSFDVPGLAPGRHAFRLRQTDADGAVHVSVEARATVAPTSAVWLGPPAPNPAAGTVHVRFAVAAGGPARLALYDALGRRVAVLFDGSITAGTPLDATFDAARLLSGAYVLVLTTPTGTARRTVTVT